MDTGMFGLAKYAALKKDMPDFYTIEAVIEMIKSGKVKIEGYTLIKDTEKDIKKETKSKKPKSNKTKAKTTEGENK